MAGRTSQLQIRVSLEQKAALKRLAAAAGQNVSQYVLARSLPRSQDAIARGLDELRRGGDSRSGLAAVASALAGLGPEDLETSLASWSAVGMTPLTQNRLAALVEDLSSTRGIDPPLWVEAVPPLQRPHFRWSLDSLRSYQLRSTPAAYKRRNLFDSHATPAGAESRPPENLASLSRHLATLELDVEFYFVAGSVMRQSFPARPHSARPRDLFQPSGEGDPVAAFTAGQGWSFEWASDSVTGIVGRRRPPGAFLDIPHLAVFQPPAEYVLAVKLAALRPEPTARDLEDLRLLLHALDLSSDEGARSSTSRYVADRHVPAHARTTLRSLLAG
jgi:hypothetical protein